MHKTLITLFLCLLLNCLVGTVGRGADFTNAGIHLARGNYADAALSAVGSIPGIGDVLKGGKQAVKATSVTVGVVSQGVKHAGDAAGAGKVAAKGGQEAASGASKSVGDGGCGKFDKNGDSLCFTAGTQVIVGAEFTEDDVFVQYVTTNIEYIKVGDFVYSYDTITGVVTQKEVTAVFVRESDHINYLTIVDEYGCEQVIETTDGHPFWVVTNEPDLSRAAREVVDENGVILYHENLEPGINGYWVEAKDLREGDVFIGANGELSVLVAIERVVFPECIKVYNFTVDGNHNYFVIATTDEFGQTCILVHNANETLYRMGTAKESVDRLKTKAADADSKIGIHGVSVSSNQLSKKSSSASRSEVEKSFAVHNTPTLSNPLHRTVELPKPVTNEVAEIFNNLFGR